MLVVAKPDDLPFLVVLPSRLLALLFTMSPYHSSSSFMGGLRLSDGVAFSMHCAFSSLPSLVLLDLAYISWLPSRVWTLKL